MTEAFRTEMAAGYVFDEPVIVLGSPILGDQVFPDVRVQIPLSRINRHGLIAGATGTGKTKTLQLLAGQLSAAGVPVFAVDVKGDVQVRTLQFVGGREQVKFQASQAALNILRLRFAGGA